MTASVDSCAEMKSAPSVAYVTSPGKVWRKVPESDARSGVDTVSDRTRPLMAYTSTGRKNYDVEMCWRKAAKPRTLRQVGEKQQHLGH